MVVEPQNVYWIGKGQLLEVGATVKSDLEHPATILKDIGGVAVVALRTSKKSSDGRGHIDSPPLVYLNLTEIPKNWLFDPEFKLDSGSVTCKKFIGKMYEADWKPIFDAYQKCEMNKKLNKVKIQQPRHPRPKKRKR